MNEKKCSKCGLKQGRSEYTANQFDMPEPVCRQCNPDEKGGRPTLNEKKCGKCGLVRGRSEYTQTQFDMPEPVCRQCNPQEMGVEQQWTRRNVGTAACCKDAAIIHHGIIEILQSQCASIAMLTKKMGVQQRMRRNVETAAWYKKGRSIQQSSLI